MSASAMADEYYVKVTGEVKGLYEVEATIETNLPDEALLAVDLSLSGLEPDDIAIGTGFVRTPISNGSAVVTIDGVKKAQPVGIDLPSGEYELEASFYPRWKENKELAASLGIMDTIESKTTISLEASGIDRNVVIERQNDQSWVMNNVYSGTPWDYGFWAERFGDIKQIEYTGSGNPRILKNFYIPKIDMTIKVNAPRGEVITWVSGFDSE